jgi:hypothetical protein
LYENPLLTCTLAQRLNNFYTHTKKSKEMPTNKEILVQMNAELFGMRQPSKEHEMFVVGRRQKKADDATKTEIVYQLKSSPNAAAIAAKIGVQDFIHAAFKPLGSITVNAEGRRSFKGPKKAKTSVIFLNSQPDLYNYIREGIEMGDMTDKDGKVINEQGGYKKAGFDSQKRPMIKLMDTVWGLKVGFNTPLYQPHSMNKQGKLVPLTATTLDPKTGKYSPKAVIIGYYEFFADDDDLDKLLEVCARQYEKHVKPYLKETVTTVTEKGNSKEVTVKDPEINAPVGEINEDGDLVDDQGVILKTAAEIEEENTNIE